MKNVAGMVATDFGGGSADSLGCRYGVGRAAARALASQVDTLICWGVRDVASLLPSYQAPKVVLIHHGDLNNDWYDLYIASQADVASAVVAINPDVAAHAKRRLACRVEYIPNAVDPARIAPATKLDRTPRTVVWCARFSTEKRLHLVVDAARLLPDWRFVIIGDGHDRPVDPPANVILTGRLPNQADWLAVADVFLSTSDQEGFGLSMAEAMLAGVPVVATPFGLGATDTVEQLPAHPTPAEVAAAIIRPVDRDRTQRAQRQMAEHHSPDKIVEKWGKLIERLHSPPGRVEH